MQIPWYIGLPCVAAIGFGFLSWQASRAPYYPFRYPQGYWDVQRELGAEDVWITASDGVRLHGWWVGAPGSEIVTLFLHGNAGNVTHRFPQIREITAAGSSILMLDYRGYGKSEGSPGERGLYRDADAAYRHLLTRGWRPKQIVLHGESLGAAVAVELAARVECRGIILEAPFTSGRDVAATVLPVLGPLLFRGFDTRSKIAKVRAPLWLIHGQRDDIIPIRMGRALFAAAPAPKEFFEIPAAGHNDILETAGPEYRRRLEAFYSALAPPPER